MFSFTPSRETDNRPPEGDTLGWAEGGNLLSVYLKQEVPPPSKFRLLEDCRHRLDRADVFLNKAFPDWTARYALSRSRQQDLPLAPFFAPSPTVKPLPLS